MCVINSHVNEFSVMWKGYHLVEIYDWIRLLCLLYVGILNWYKNVRSTWRAIEFMGEETGGSEIGRLVRSLLYSSVYICTNESALFNGNNGLSFEYQTIRSHPYMQLEDEEFSLKCLHFSTYKAFFAISISFRLRDCIWRKTFFFSFTLFILRVHYIISHLMMSFFPPTHYLFSYRFHSYLVFPHYNGNSMNKSIPLWLSLTWNWNTARYEF